MALTVIYHNGELVHTEIITEPLFTEANELIEIVQSPNDFNWQKKWPFKYWAENIDGSGKKYYAPNEDDEVSSFDTISCNINENKTVDLYGVWETSSYINYYNNIEDNEEPTRQYIDISSTIFSQTTIRKNYYFNCWNTKQDGTGTNYSPNDSITLQENEVLNLYAIWEPITYLTSHSTLTSIANAIRTNNGESTLYSFPEGFISGISNIDINKNDNNKFIKYLKRQLEIIDLTTFKSTTIPSYTFYAQSILSSIIGGNNIISINEGAFQKCYSITTISFPNCITIGNLAFADCRFSVIDFPVCNIIGSSAFRSCINLTFISFPMCTTINHDAFYDCSQLTTINFPVCSLIEAYAFLACSNLINVAFPKCETIHSGAFYNCSNLTSIYLNNSSVCSLSSSYAFYSTQITSTTGSIYVPASLLTEYQSAPEWSYFSTQFVSIT